MIKHALIVLAFLIIAEEGCGQKYTIEKSLVTFFSDAAIEDIKADNKETSGIFNSDNSEIVFSVPINEFQFEKSLMQEHFNEKYMESGQYPRSTFQGKINAFNKDAKGVQTVKAKGRLTIHGVTKSVEIPGTIEKRNENWAMHTKFIVRLEDYKVAIPQLLWQNIAEQVEVTAEFSFKPYP